MHPCRGQPCEPGAGTRVLTGRWCGFARLTAALNRLTSNLTLPAWCGRYIIPYAVIQHFMEEFEVHGSFRGCCALGFRYQDMENKHLRESLKASGPRRLQHFGCASPYMRPWHPA